MKTIKLMNGHPYDGRYYGAGECIHVPDDVARAFLKLGAEEMPAGTPVSNPEIGHLAEAVSPLVPGANPRHAAEALKLDAATSPALADLDAAEAAPPLPAAPGPKRPAKSSS